MACAGRLLSHRTCLPDPVVEEDIDVVSFGDSVHEEYSGDFDVDKSADSW